MASTFARRWYLGRQVTDLRNAEVRIVFAWLSHRAGLLRQQV
jgi:hypothetical protein